MYYYENVKKQIMIGCYNKQVVINQIEVIMRAVVTRVSEASVEIDGQIKGQIKKGFLILLGIHVDDTEEKAL